MKSVTGRELARLLENHRWALLRIHGSHHVYGKPGSVVRISVPKEGIRSSWEPAPADGPATQREDDLAVLLDQSEQPTQIDLGFANAAA
jgi:predicted RNA binding protein YcfA (HicA-like mRNA interferase family)